MAIGADSRTCTIIDGKQYQLKDDETKLYENEKGLVFYCSGEIGMSKEVAQKLLEAEYLYTPTILNILKVTFKKHIKQNPTIRDFKHTLQLVIPVQEDGIWKVVYFDNENNFEPHMFSAASSEVYVFAIGVGMHVAQPLLEDHLNNKDGQEIQVFEAFEQAYSAAADEACGGTLSYIAYTDNGIINKTTQIKDTKRIRRYTDMHVVEHGQGDGIILNPDGSNKSGVARIDKPNGLWSFIYNNNNYGRERRLVMQDKGIELSAETGDVVIGHDNGSFIRIKGNGDIEINSIGKVIMNGQEYMFE